MTKMHMKDTEGASSNKQSHNMLTYNLIHPYEFSFHKYQNTLSTQ